MKKIFLLLVLIIPLINHARGQKKPTNLNPPGLKEIRLADLKNDMDSLASDHFRGRIAGSLDELKSAMWIAKKYKEIGLLPAGEDGTYFQYFNLWRNRISPNSSISIGNTKLNLWSDAAISQMANINLDLPINYLGNSGDLNLGSLDVKGKVIALEASPKGIDFHVSLPTWRYGRSMMVKYGNELIRKGAVAIIFVADEYGEKSWADATENFKLGLYDIDGGSNTNVKTEVPVIWVHSGFKNIFQTAPGNLKINLMIERFTYPSVNVIGKINGTDPVLSKEYLLFSGHTDAHGIRNPILGDTIYHGADDNASVDVALLASARAFKKYPGKRSVLFVIHGAEEKGLLGSRYYSSHPTVPIHSIVAVLNGDMIGRNNPDSAALLGVQKPHRNSLDLVNMALTANIEGPKFKLDTLWDKPNHIEGWYFRSDHLPYARLGIPALMYTTLLHPDYHTPQDNAANIDLPKLKRMTEWFYRTGWKVVNAPARPATDLNFKLER